MTGAGGSQVLGRVDAADLLGLPFATQLTERLAKRVLREQFVALTGASGDGKLVDRAVDRVWVIGVLRPRTIQVPAYRGHDDGTGHVRSVDDVPVMRVVLTESTTSGERRRLAELLHRSMPRPVVVVLDAPDRPTELALALTHVSRTDPQKTSSVIDHALVVPLADLPAGALDVACRDRTDLWALYRDLVLQAATGGSPASSLRAEEAVEAHHRLTALRAERDAAVREAKRAASQQERITANGRARTLRGLIEATSGTLYSCQPES